MNTTVPATNLRTASVSMRSAGRVVVSLAVIPTLLVVGAGTANAEGDWTQHIAGTGTDGLYVHTGPGLAAPTTVILAEGTEVVTDCVSYADTIGGTDPAWLHITSPTEGWIADYYVDTVWSSENTLPMQGLPECGGQASNESVPSDDGGTVSEVPTIAAPYDRGTAAQWALEHAQDRQPWSFAGCTWFVSRALWAGGLPETDTWNSSQRHGSLDALPGTPAATAVDPFIDNLRATYPLTDEVPLGADRFASNAVPEAEVGDIIAYDWEGDGDFDHLTIVTSIDDGSYPYVAEWGTTNVLEGTVANDYVERGWTYSENDDAWLQDPNRHHPSPNVTAALFHINVVVSPTF